MRAFFIQNFVGKLKLLSWNITREICVICFPTKKAHAKCWWNWHLISLKLWSQSLQLAKSFTKTVSSLFKLELQKSDFGSFGNDVTHLQILRFLTLFLLIIATLTSHQIIYQFHICTSANPLFLIIFTFSLSRLSIFSEQTDLYNDYPKHVKNLKIYVLQIKKNWQDPGLNFINVLCTAFTHVDPKCTKRRLSQQCHLALLGPMSVKAACKTLVKLTPGVNFTNILLTL